MKDYQVMNGSHGEVWLDSDYVGECTGVQAKVDIKKEQILMCGRMNPGSKVVGWEGKGSLKMNKVNSRMLLLIGEKIKKGLDPRFTIISNLEDTAAAGAERIVLKDVSFDDVTLADWEVGKNGSVECPFTFGDYEFLDIVEPED